MSASVDISADNPFPAQAVTTFGPARPEGESPPVVQLRSLRQARDVAARHLAAWVYTGAAMAISGAHGAGKTFILQQVAEHLAAHQTLSPHVIYVKADNPSIVALYRLVMAKLSRVRLLELVSEAIRRHALEVTGAAKGTLSARAEIEKTRSVDPAYAEGVLDSNVMRTWLRTTLEEASEVESVSQRVAAAVGLLDHPELGNAAYQWLDGSLPSVAAMGSSALSTPLLDTTGTEPVDAVIATLECIARLHTLAERPFVLMVDQMEALLAAPNGPDNGSFVKKLAEQLKARQAIVIFAGTSAGWRRLPVDAGPRLWEGEPLQAGALDEDETRSLVGAYRTPHYSSEGLVTLRQLTGGNPRAILQTSHQVFNLTGGRLQTADDVEIGQGFAASGMLRDRARIAMDLLRDEARAAGFDISVAHGQGAQPDDLLLTRGRRTRILVAVLQLTDRIHETIEASRITELRRELSVTDPATRLLVVSVGYTSGLVRGLLKNIATAVIPYDEATYLADLRPTLARLAEQETPDIGTSTAPTAPRDTAASELELKAQLDRLHSLIGEVERLRRDADEKVSERFATDIERIARPEIQKARVEVREDLREGVVRLRELLRDDGKVDEERRLIRSLVIANESGLQDEAFDLLGGLYLEAAGEAAHNPSRELEVLRNNLLRHMDQSLSGTSRHWLETEPLRSLAAVLLGVAVFGLTYTFITAGMYVRDSVALTTSLVAGLAAGAALVLSLEFRRRPQLRYRFLVRRLAAVRRSLKR